MAKVEKDHWRSSGLRCGPTTLYSGGCPGAFWVTLEKEAPWSVSLESKCLDQEENLQCPCNTLNKHVQQLQPLWFSILLSQLCARSFKPFFYLYMVVTRQLLKHLTTCLRISSTADYTTYLKQILSSCGLSHTIYCNTSTTPNLKDLHIFFQARLYLHRYWGLTYKILSLTRDSINLIWITSFKHQLQQPQITRQVSIHFNSRERRQLNTFRTT